jgi:quercetin dioxygenase-like cupin family protein
MEVKHNNATKNRPEGSRDLDAPFIMIDIPALIRQLKSERAWQDSDRNGITAYKSGAHTLVLTGLHKDAIIKDNTVKGFLTLQVIEGSIILWIDDEEMTMEDRGIVCIHPGIRHTIKAETDALILLHDHA